MSRAKQYSCSSDLARHLRAQADKRAPPETDADRVRKYRADILGFARDVLGIQPWSKQARILEAVLTHKRVSVVSGHKVGKSTALAIIALWFYCTFPGARVVITAPTDRQVNKIIWREIRRLVRGARVPIPGASEIHTLARSGLHDPSDFSEIVGYTASDKEAIAGVSGGWILYLVDEASGVGQEIYEAIEGNRAGGNAWLFLISNPTRPDGEFYDSHHRRKLDPEDPDSTGYYCIHIDSRESPNVTGEWVELEEWDRTTERWIPRRDPVPGLASPEWVAEKLREWGEENPLFCMRVSGKFVAAEQAKAFPLALLADAITRWPEIDATGRLWIGFDPAGEGDGGDEHGFAARRGAKLLELRARRGLTREAALAEIRDLIASHHAAGFARPVVCLDADGEEGWKHYVFLKEHAERTLDFELVRVRGSEKAVRAPQSYQIIRDELAANLREWLREGGAIHEHVKLLADLGAYEFEAGSKGRLRLISKRKLREKLGRSPDLGDSLMLSVWEPLSVRDQDAPPPRAERRVIHSERTPMIDPYRGLDPFQRRS